MINARRRVRSIGPRKIIAFSSSFERIPLLERGLGLEHVKDLLTRLARPIISSGVSIAYAGNWHLGQEDNFTNLFLRLISAEQDDSSLDAEPSADAARKIEPLINHLAWPYYLDVTPRIEAEWINACRIVRVTQENAGIAAADRAADDDASSGSDRAVLNAAITLSATRRLQTIGMTRQVVPTVLAETLPPLSARIIVGGRILGSHGFLTGVFEESLLALEAGVPLYVLGGFGGAASDLAAVALGSPRPCSFDPAWLEKINPSLKRINALAQVTPSPPIRTTAMLLAALEARLATDAAKGNALNTGLLPNDLAALMQTSDVDDAVRLILKGLRALSAIN